LMRHVSTEADYARNMQDGNTIRTFREGAKRDSGFS